jgi:CRISPR-associated RAMP protein (TIGR02581 family)
MTTQQQVSCNEQVPFFDVFTNRLTVRGTLVAETALRVGAGRATEVTSNDLPVLRDQLNRPFIPGASLKGAFRAQLESLIAALDPSQSPDLATIEKRTGEKIKPLKEQEMEDIDLTRAIWRFSTMIDLTFGSPEIAGRLFFKDALVKEELWYEQFEVRNGVVLNRDTETAEDGLLYDYEVVPVGTPFTFELVLENAAEWQVGMVLMALQPWERGEMQVGGFRSRGLGYVALKEVQSTYHRVQGADDVVRILCNDEVLQQLGIAPQSEATVTDDQRTQWYKAFHQVLHKIAHTSQSHAKEGA